MGWDYSHYTEYKNGKLDRKAILDGEMTCEDDSRSVSVLKSSMVGSTWYAAIRSVNKTNGFETVFGCVALTHSNARDYYNFGYKLISEDMGPYSYDCPKCILDMLSEPSNEWAAEWREKCKAKRTEKKTKSLSAIPVGAYLEIKTTYGKTFTCVKKAPNHQFRTPWFYIPAECKYVSKKRIAEWKILESE